MFHVCGVQRYPKVDLRANCNKINIRTCSDSLAALAELINYLSNSGDLSGGSQQSAPSVGSHRVRSETSIIALRAVSMQHPSMLATY